MIPKIIMQTWKTHDIPDKWKPSVESIRKYMPDWEHIVMSDEDNREFVSQYFPDFLPYYDAFPYPIERADAIRYMWLYVKGGLYLDLDIELSGSLEPLLSNGDIFFAYSGNVGSSFTNSIMASRPHHPIWLEFIEMMKKRVIPWWCISKHIQIMIETGPGLVNDVLSSTHHSYSVFPKKLISAYSICDTCYDKDTLIRPLEGGSWTSGDTLLYGFFYCYPSLIVVFLLTFIITLILVYYDIAL